MSVSGGRQQQSIEVRKAERELFFWTAHQTLRLVLFAAVVIYAIASMISGELPGIEQLVRLAQAL